VPLRDRSGNITGLCGIARNISERKAVEESLRESNERIHNLAVHLQSIQEEERKRIARDIHDEFGQVLTALKYDLSWVIKNMPEDNIRLVETSKKMSKFIDHAVKTVQRISLELRPALLDELGLVAAFEWFCKDYQRRTSIKCSIICETDETALDKDLSTAVFRAFQEALTNVARHAGATRVDISMKELDGELVFRVVDNGRGITKKDINSTKSYGLIGIKERFYPWKGEVEITGEKGKGTTVSVRVPLAPVKKSLQQTAFSTDKNKR
jgi:signal transduction histidine kinase